MTGLPGDRERKSRVKRWLNNWTVEIDLKVYTGGLAIANSKARMEPPGSGVF